MLISRVLVLAIGGCLQSLSYSVQAAPVNGHQRPIFGGLIAAPDQLDAEEYALSQRRLEEWDTRYFAIFRGNSAGNLRHPLSHERTPVSNEEWTAASSLGDHLPMDLAGGAQAGNNERVRSAHRNPQSYPIRDASHGNPALSILDEASENSSSDDSFDGSSSSNDVYEDNPSSDDLSDGYSSEDVSSSDDSSDGYSSSDDMSEAVEVAHALPPFVNPMSSNHESSRMEAGGLAPIFPNTREARHAYANIRGQASPRGIAASDDALGAGWHEAYLNSLGTNIEPREAVLDAIEKQRLIGGGSNESSEEITPETQCVICLDSLVNKNEKPSDIVRLHKCSHVFHGNCLKEWISSRNSARNCPTCRGRITI